MNPTAYCKIGLSLPGFPFILTRQQTKTLRVMKVTTILLLAACIQVSANGFSQKVRLTTRAAPLNKVFKEIQRQTGNSFWYKPKEIDKPTRVTLDLQTGPL